MTDALQEGAVTAEYLSPYCSGGARTSHLPPAAGWRALRPQGQPAPPRPAGTTSKEEASVEQWLPKLPPAAVHPSSSAVLHLLSFISFSSFPVTPQCNVPTGKGGREAVNKLHLPAADGDSWACGRGSLAVSSAALCLACKCPFPVPGLSKT